MPTHLYHYTPESLDKILECSGWKMEKVWHHRFLDNIFSSIGYALQDRGFNNGWVENLSNFANRSGKKQFYLYPLAYIFSLFGQTGRMTVWARRIDD